MSTLKADFLLDRLGTRPPTVLKAEFVRAYCKYIVSGGVPSFSGSSFGASALRDVQVGQANMVYIALLNSGGHPFFGGSWYATTWAGKTEGSMSTSQTEGAYITIDNGAATDPSATTGAVMQAYGFLA